MILDFGLTYDYQNPERILAGVLTHFHADHSDGVAQFMKLNQRPVFMSKGTFAFLYQHYAGKPERTLLSLFSRIISMEVDAPLGDGARLSIFPVYHCTGSMGFGYKDKQGKTLIYLGDFCLSNAFLDYRSNIEEVIRSKSGKRTALVLDASMVRRKGQQIAIEDNPNRVLGEVATALSSRSVFILTSAGESMVYTYILAYQTMIMAKVRNPIFVPRELFVHLYVLWDSVMKASGKFKDPVLKSGAEAISLNFAETQQLYPLNEATLSSVPKTVPILVFSDLETLEACPNLLERMPKSDVVLTGVLALREDIPESILKQRPRQLLRVASSDWSFHSNENDLAALCGFCLKEDLRIFLFHNFPNRIRDFINELGLSDNSVFYGDHKIDF